MRQTPKMTLAPCRSTNSQEMISFFSSLPLRETQSCSKSHNCKTPQAEERVNRKSKFKGRICKAKAVCVRECLDAPASPTPASSPPPELAGEGVSRRRSSSWCCSKRLHPEPVGCNRQTKISMRLASKANPRDALRSHPLGASALSLLGCTQGKHPALLGELKCSKQILTQPHNHNNQSARATGRHQEL